MLLNLTSASATVGLHWNDLALLPGAKVRDLWAHKDLGSFKDGYAAEIPAHGSLMLKISGDTNWRKGAVYEAEWPGNIRQGAVQLLECGECSESFGVAIGGSSSGEETGGGLVFPQVTMPRAGHYTLQLFFLRNGLEDKSVTVQINDAEPTPHKIQTFVWASVDVPVDLKSGNNVVTVRYAGKSSFYLDRIKAIVARESASVGVRDSARSGNTNIVHTTLKGLCDTLQTKARSLGRKPVRILGAGMITSSLGLLEIDHVPPPAGEQELAGSMRQISNPQISELPICLVPGVRTGPAQPEIADLPDVDVIRGEETLCVGLQQVGMLTPHATLLNLGSHWKAITLDGGASVLLFASARSSN